MKRRSLPAFCVIWVAIVSFGTSGCAQFSGFQTAKTVPKGQGELGFSGGVTSTVNGFDPATELQNTGFPIGEIWGRYGISDKLDIGVKVSTLFSSVADAKYMLVGSESSAFALGLGVGLGLQYFVVAPAFQFHLPVYISIHPSPNFALYASPRYVRQVIGSADSFEGGVYNYAGLSSGLEVGKNVRFGFDISYFRVIDQVELSSSANVFQVGLGMKFRFGEK